MEPSEYYREMGHRLRRKRQMLGWTQAELAGRVPLPQSQLSRLERGDFQMLDAWQFKRLCDTLLTTPDFVLGYTDEPGAVPLDVCQGAQSA